MDTLNNIILVFLSGIVELWLAVPLGFTLELSPLNTAFFSSLGSITAAFIVTFSGSGLRIKFLKWRYRSDEVLKNSWMYKVWNKYGVIGLGLLSPLLFGAPLGAALGIILGARKNHLLSWMILGIILWGVGLTTAVYLGLITIKSGI
jgi:hypothetical protein